MMSGCVVGDSLDSLPQGGADAGANDTDATPGGGPDGGGPAADAAPGEPTARSVLDDFGNCMTLADWDAQDLGQIALTVTQPLGEVCADCHSGGTGGNFLSIDSTATFERIKTYPYILKYANVDADLNPIFVDRLILKGQEVGGVHPTFTLALDLQQGLQNFFDLTNARYLAGTCPP
jgi:hypothetical protein